MLLISVVFVLPRKKSDVKLLEKFWLSFGKTCTTFREGHLGLLEEGLQKVGFLEIFLQQVTLLAIHEMRKKKI